MFEELAFKDRMKFDIREGFFCGAGCSSYDLHIDCIPSSNVGSVFTQSALGSVFVMSATSKHYSVLHSFVKLMIAKLNECLTVLGE